MIDNKVLNYPSVPADDCPKGNPVNGDSTCEAYEADSKKCTVTNKYCTREDYNNEISNGVLSW